MLKFIIVPILLLAHIAHGSRSVTLNNVIVQFLNFGETTNYFLISELAPEVNPESAWLAVGLNSKSQMVITLKKKITLSKINNLILRLEPVLWSVKMRMVKHQLSIII